MAVGAHIGSWSEKDLLGLPDHGQRYELVEGALLVNPPPGGRHQLVSWELTRQLKHGCPSELLVVEALGVRLPEETVFVPDVLIAERQAVLADQAGIIDASAVLLVAEIVSPGSRTIDRLTKPPLYAQAGIPSFWRVELEAGPTVFAYRLEQRRYVEVASAEPGHRLAVDQPFSLSLDPASLRP